MECINHVGYCQPDGYGQKKHQGRVVLAHRLAYAQANNLDVFSMGGVVRHQCDNPRCVNPAHLLLGTYAENMQDALDRGRFKQAVPADQIAVIQAKYTRGVKGRPGNGLALAAEYGVTLSTIRAIVGGRRAGS